MSWSVSFLGKPEAVAEVLDKYSDKLSGQSRIEYDEAKPHLMALVRQNFVGSDSTYVLPLIDLEASGSGSSKGDPSKGEEVKQLWRSCQVSLKTHYYKTLV